MSKFNILTITTIFLSLMLLVVTANYFELKEEEFDRQMKYRCEVVLNQYMHSPAYYSKYTDTCETPSFKLIGESQIEEAIKLARIVRNVKVI